MTVSVLAAMAALGVLGSGVAYILNYRIVAVAGASTASTVTYLTPLVAAVVGVVVLGESVSWNQPAGGVVIVLGVALAQGRLRKGRFRPIPTSAATRTPDPVRSLVATAAGEDGGGP